MTEEELYETKWWDYRPLTPEQATLECTKEYLEALDNHNEMMGNHSMKNSIWRSIDIQHPNRWRHWKVMTRLRQFADQNFMKYDEFWITAFVGIIELKIRNTYLTAFLNKRLQTWTLERYKKQHSYYINMARSDYFKAENYTAQPFQDAYYHYLVTSCGNDKSEIVKLLDDGKISMKYFDNAGIAINLTS